MRELDPGDEHTLHRIEAFSDIVIGFCLAETGLDLSTSARTMPQAVFWQHVMLFAISFFLVVWMWWSHHRIFKTYFTLTRVSIMINFVMLGLLVFALYFMQLASRDVIVPGVNFVLYWAIAYGGVYILLAVMLGLGARARWQHLAAADRVWALSIGVRMVIAAVLIPVIAWNSHLIANPQLRNIVIAGMVALVFVNRVLIPRTVARLVSSPP